MILVVAGVMRFAMVTVSPGFEWDEPVYAQIAAQTNVVGYPSAKIDGNMISTEPYLYQPPFDFYLKAAWFNTFPKTDTAGDVGLGRLLSATEGMIALVLAFFCIQEIAGPNSAIVGLILLATDGWIVYTNRLNLIDNGMIPWGIFGVWMYAKACKSQAKLYYVIAGLFLAFAAVYKQTGIPFLFVPIINWLMTRKNFKNHALLLLTMVLVVLGYIGGLFAIWPKEFIFDTWVQIERTLGHIPSRGLNYGLQDAIKAVVQTYFVFVVTIVAITGVGLAVAYRVIQVICGQKQLFNSILLSWSIAAFGFLTVIALKAPQYLIIVLVPAYMFIASEFGAILDRAEDRLQMLQSSVNLDVLAKRIVVGALAFTVAANMVTWGVRFIAHHDNALLETYRYFQTVPSTSHVLADDPVGVVITQPYYNIDRHWSEQSMIDANPDYIVLYTTYTQKTPNYQELKLYIAKSTIVRTIVGFKETILIYRVNKGGS